MTKKKPVFTSNTDCPCQSGLLLAQCCQPFLDTHNPATAETAEQLMRSRYSAYVLKNQHYLLTTWHPQQRPAELDFEHSEHHWIGLKIKSCQQGQSHDIRGSVHFVARFKINGKAQRLEEQSLFEKINGQWFYVKAKLIE